MLVEQEVELEMRDEQIEQFQLDIQAKEVQIRANDDLVNQLQTEITTKNDQLADLIKQMEVYYS